MIILRRNLCQSFGLPSLKIKMLKPKSWLRKKLPKALSEIPVPSENIIVLNLFSHFLTVFTQQFSHSDGAGHRPGEMQHSCPSPVVQQSGIQADLCSTTNGFCKYGNSGSTRKGFCADVAHVEYRDADRPIFYASHSHIAKTVSRTACLAWMVVLLH